MKTRFTRWLPAITQTDFRQYAQTKIEQADLGRRLEQAKALQTDLRGLTQHQIRRLDLGRLVEGNRRKAVLTVAGVAAVGGLAAGPALASGDSTSPNVNPAAAAQLRQAVVADKTDVKPLVGQPTPDAGRATTDSAGQARAAAPKAGDSPMRKVAEKPAEKPSLDELIPYGTQGQQVSTPLSDDQWDNARAIVQTAKREGVGERGAVIGVATSLQESKLENLGHLGSFNDHDSLGLFQQRPSSGWGTPSQVTDPDYAASAFFNGLKRVNGWQNMPLTQAAQTVQVSAFPFAYAQWENQAAHIVQDLWSNR
ncbi:hypothetical protein BDK92_7734 [Micromonospora pisi]|uniref:Uncharacterized protein n=1 Tax=Micromonospora pisi TaxID=589240 RepID=A0A495JW04_9ACTN|nr:hypothetical protein [Micromonospora pisi]RKR93213.1 hypothetical protein BDK92_7734 [Micromonospora pisi]